MKKAKEIQRITSIQVLLDMLPNLKQERKGLKAKYKKYEQTKWGALMLAEVRRCNAQIEQIQKQIKRLQKALKYSVPELEAECQVLMRKMKECKHTHPSWQVWLKSYNEKKELMAYLKQNPSVANKEYARA